MIVCKKCGFQPKNESHLDEHHIVPKFMGGTDKDGRIYLCAAGFGLDCHRKLHEHLKIVVEESTKIWLKE